MDAKQKRAQYLCVIIESVEEKKMKMLKLYRKKREAKAGLLLHHSRKLVELQKSLSGIKKGFLVASVRLGTLNSSSVGCQYHIQNPPLCLLLTSDVSVQQELKRLSQESGLSRPTWLLFLNRNISIEKFFADINIPFDCMFLVAQARGPAIDITEAYKVAAAMPLMLYPYASWSHAKSFRTALRLYKRRNQLHGLEMKGVAINDFPITRIFNTKDNNLMVEGFFGSLWSILERMMNFTTTFRKGTGFGTQVNGKWNGMIEMLRKQEVDIALNGFTVTKERMRAVDYTLPLITSKYQVFIRKSTYDDLFWANFLEPFSMELWLTIGMSVVLLAIFLSMLHSTGRRFGNDEADGPSRYYFYDSLHYVFGIFCQQGHDFTPKASSCRMVYLSAYLTAVVLLSAYSAALISFLTKQRVVIPFKNLEGLLADGTYKIGALEKSAQYDLFNKSSDNVMQEVFRKLIEREVMPDSHDSGFERVCSGKYGYISEIHFLTQTPVRCAVTVLPDEVFPSLETMALPKHSPYKGIINYNLQVLRDRGAIKRLSAIWMKTELPKLRNSLTAVNIENISPILVVLAAGLIMASLFFILEKEWHRFYNFRNKQPQNKN